MIENTDGLARLALYELHKVHPHNKEEAQNYLAGKIGAYQHSSTAIKRGINIYFNGITNIAN